MDAFNKLHLVGAMTPIVTIQYFPNDAAAQNIPGTPEPELVLYNSVLKTNGNRALAPASVNWVFTTSGATVTSTSTLVYINGQCFYLVRSPFEIRTVSSQTFSAITIESGLV